jgi:hypothetical protein
VLVRKRPQITEVSYKVNGDMIYHTNRTLFKRERATKIKIIVLKYLCINICVMILVVL